MNLRRVYLETHLLQRINDVSFRSFEIALNQREKGRSREGIKYATTHLPGTDYVTSMTTM